MATTNDISKLKQRTSDFTHVYFMKADSGTADYSSPDFEFPVVEGSINYSLGEVSYEYVKLVSGVIWATKRTKGDPEISFQIATNNSSVAELFGTVTPVESIKTPTIETAKQGVSVDFSKVKVATGTVIFTDDAGNAEILPGCELTASRGKDSVAYWNVKVVPGDKVLMTT